MAEEHEREERPFEPSRAPSWKGSSRDLVVNPPAFFKELDELVERYGRTLRRDPDEIARELRDDVFSDSSLRPSKKLARANELLEGHGVESIGRRYSYINFGDTYDPSIIYDSEEDKFFVSTMGDVEQERATQAEQEGWDYWLGKEFRRDLENLCEDNPKALAAIEALDDEGLKRLFHEAMRDTQGAEFIHETDDSVAVHKLDKVVDTAYQKLEGRTPNRRGSRRRNSGESTLEQDGTLLWLLDGARESAESPVSDGDLEITEELSKAGSDYEDALMPVLEEAVRRYPPKDGATAQDLWDAEAPYKVLMNLRGEGVGIWDGDWDHFYDDTKPVETLLKQKLRKFADDSGGGSLNNALYNAVYEAERRTGKTREENRRPNANATELKLHDRASGGVIHLRIRDGVVVAATGSEPKRYLGLTEQEARHKARYSNR